MSSFIITRRFFFNLQVQSYFENFFDTCGDDISWLSNNNFFPGFTEGWATYAEHPLASDDAGLYSNTSDRTVLLQKYGMTRYQVRSDVWY